MTPAAPSDTQRTQTEFDRIRRGLIDHKWGAEDALNGMRDFAIGLERELNALRASTTEREETAFVLGKWAGEATGYGRAVSERGVSLGTTANEAIDAAMLSSDADDRPTDKRERLLVALKALIAWSGPNLVINDHEVKGLTPTDLIEALEAPQSASEAPRWRDTKVTVPCDGDDVLAYWCSVVGNGETAWCVAHYYSGHWHNPDDDEDDYRAPDFWMPLPSAPVDSRSAPTDSTSAPTEKTAKP